MNRTKIPWCNWTWNPIVGCSPASAGCLNCYAKRISRRHAENPTLPEHVRAAHRRALSDDRTQWRDPPCLTFLPERLAEPARVRTPGLVFVCSTSDLGHERVLWGWREDICDAMRAAPWHQYIACTKRPGPWLRQLPPTCWVGVTIEDQMNIGRWPLLWNMAWARAVLFVSVEPMLGPLTFQRWRGQCEPDQVIAGPETGPGARLCEDAWIDALAAESPCFFDKRKVWKRREFPQGAGVRP
ncbi:MAG: DUF5131 family protein [Kiritimatiellae bacterium]|nr:DUF5131 family protein [Kiritimatiellia bacterium]